MPCLHGMAKPSPEITAGGELTASAITKGGGSCLIAKHHATDKAPRGRLASPNCQKAASKDVSIAIPAV